VAKIKAENPADFDELMNTIRDVSAEVIEILQE
jgi:hypothetical protein